MTIQLEPLQIGGHEVLVAVVPRSGTERTSAAGDRVKNAALDALSGAQELISAVATGCMPAARSLAHMAMAPTSLEVDLGLSFSADGRIIVAGAGVEAGIVIRLHYDIQANPGADKEASRQ